MKSFPAIASAAVFALVILADGMLYDPGAALASHAGGADFFGIDMDASGAPANTATSIGSVDGCARIVQNGVQDADEDGVDLLEFDVVASNIPASAAMISFGFTIVYDESALTIQDEDSHYLIAANPGSQLFDVAFVPDTDGDDRYPAGVLDIGWEEGESGSGVLQRITISADAGASAGLYDLTFDPAKTGHMDANADDYLPDVLITGQIAIDYYCPGVDYDGDGVWDLDEENCGGVPLDANLRPERVDGPFAAVDDNGDTVVDEALPPGSEGYDCDGDGFSGAVEDHVYSYMPQTNGDQKTCQEYDTNFPDPNQTMTPSLRWPSDLNASGASFNKIDIGDLTSFVAPIYYLNTNVGTHPGDVRWDLVPGPGLSEYDINTADLSALTAGPSEYPPMLGGARAYNGPPCPWPE